MTNFMSCSIITIIPSNPELRYFHVRYGEQTVAHLDIEWLHEGWPRYDIPAVWEPPENRPLPDVGVSPQEALEELLQRVNIASKEMKSRQYDHEVKARTVIKPFTGVAADTPADATVFMVDYDRPELGRLQCFLNRLGRLDAPLGGLLFLRPLRVLGCPLIGGE